MRTIFLDTLAHFRGQVLGWGLATFLMGVLTVIRYNIFQNNQEPIPQLLAGEVGDLIRMFGDVTRLTTPGGFLSLALFSFLPLVLGAFAVLAGSGLVVADEESGILDLVLAHPVNLDHPAIVPIYEVGQHDGQHYFSMGYVEGQSLSQRLNDGPLAARRAAALLVGVAEAIDYAHQCGVIHRDLKPSNILLDPKGNPRVTDFGLAKRIRGDSGLTGSGQVMGTPSYMPPEQAGGRSADVGPAADVYALGATLYAVTTGRPPFQAATAAETMLMVIGIEPIPPRRLNTSIPRDLETICLKCLEKEPAKRYSSAAALAADLGRWLTGQPIMARPVSPAGRAWRWCRRRPALAGVLAALFMTVICLLAGGYVSVRAIAQSRNQTRAHLVRLYVDNGARLLESGDQLRSLAWFAQANALDDPSDGHRVATHRSRLGAMLDRGPRVENAWFDALPLNHAELSPDGRLVAMATGEPFGVRGTGRVEVCAVADIGAWGSTRILDHPRAVVDVTFAPNGRMLASASVDGFVRLWDVPPAQPDCHPLQCGYPIVDVEFSPDGRWLAAGCGDPYRNDARGELRIWEAATGAPATGPLPCARPCLRVAFSADSRWLVAATGCPFVEGQTGTARIIDVGSWQVTGELKHDGAVLGATFSPDSTRVVTASEDRTAQLWDRRTCRPRLAPWKHAKHVLNAAFSPDGRRVVTASRDGTAQIWDSETGAPLAPALHHTATVKAASFSADGQRVLTASSDRSARVWDARTGQPLSAPLPHAGKVVAAQFEPNGNRILTVGFEGMARLWNIEPRVIPLPLAGHTGLVSVGSFDPAGNRIVTASRDGTARIWDAQTGRPSGAVLSHGAPVLRTMFSPDGRSVLTGCSDGTACVWDVASGKPLFSPIRHSQSLNDASFSADGALLITACADGTARIWNGRTGQPDGTRFRHDGAVMSVAFHPDGTMVATAGRDQSVRVWRRDGRLVFDREQPAWVDVCRFSPSGAYLVTTCWDTSMASRSATVWNVATGKLVGGPLRHGDGVLTASFRGDSRRVVTGGEDNLAQVWEVATSRAVGLPLRHNGYVVDAAFSPDGRQIATASVDGSAHLWDAETGELLMPPLEHPAAVRCVRFSPDGRRLLTAGDYTVAYVWDITGGDRALADLAAAARFVSAHQVDDGGRLIPRELAELRGDWDQIGRGARERDVRP